MVPVSLLLLCLVPVKNNEGLHDVTTRLVLSRIHRLRLSAGQMNLE